MPKKAGIRPGYAAIVLLVAMIMSGCTPGANVFSVECKNWDELSSAEKKPIETAVSKVVQTLSSGNIDQYLDLAYPGSIGPQDKQFLIQLMKEFNDIFPEPDSREVVSGYLISIRGAAPTTAMTIDCGDPEPNPDGQTRVTIRERVKDPVVVIIRMPTRNGSKNDLSFIMAKVESNYKVIRFDVNASIFKGKEASHFDRLAQESLANDKILSSYIFYLMAHLLSYHGPFVTTGLNDRMKSELMAVQNELSDLGQYVPVDIAGQEYRIYKVGLVLEQNDFFPFIHYLSRTGPEKEKEDEEILLVTKYLKEKYPEFFKEFTGIRLVAYKVPPEGQKKGDEKYRRFVPFNAD